MVGSKCVCDGEDVIQERDGAGAVVATYLHGPGIDDPITMLRDVDGNHVIDHDAEVWHFTKDTLGSVKDLTNPQGQVVQRYRYASYGLRTLELDESRLDSKEIENPYGYAGGRLDRHTGHTNFQRRDLDHVTGTWLSLDRLWPIAGINGYEYVFGNPHKYVDPSGNSPAAVIAVLIGAGLWVWEEVLTSRETADAITPISSPVDIAAAVIGSGAAARIGAGFGAGAGEACPAANITFGHGARHLAGTGLSAAEVEAAIQADILPQLSNASSIGNFFGRVTVRGVVVEYRGFGLPGGTTNIGTYYPVLPVQP